MHAAYARDMFLMKSIKYTHEIQFPENMIFSPYVSPRQILGISCFAKPMESEIGNEFRNVPQYVDIIRINKLTNNNPNKAP